MVGELEGEASRAACFSEGGEEDMGGCRWAARARNLRDGGAAAFSSLIRRPYPLSSPAIYSG